MAISNRKVPDYRPNELISAAQAAKYLGISKSAWMERLFRTHKGMRVLDEDKNEVRRAFRRGFKLFPVAGPLYGWVTNQFRVSDVEKFGSLLLTRGGRLSSILDNLKSSRRQRPTQRAVARQKSEPLAPMNPPRQPRAKAFMFKITPKHVR